MKLRLLSGKCRKTTSEAALGMLTDLRAYEKSVPLQEKEKERTCKPRSK